MSMSRSGRRLNIHSMAPRRTTTWARSTNSFSLAVAGYATLDLLAPFKTSGGQQQGVTVVRTHLNFSVFSTATSRDIFTWGVMRGQNTDVGANIAGAPTPDLDPYEDWAMWRTEQASPTSATNAFFFPAGNNRDFDIKAQRRLPELQMTYNLVIKCLVATAAPLQLQVAASVLLKLP
jgi:hypothetical protein